MIIESTIPLTKLMPSKANARRTGATDGIAELAASIAVHGLRQNLNVKPSADGRRYEVVAGGRRLRALKQLAKDGKIAKDLAVPCMVLTETDDPQEISLADSRFAASVRTTPARPKRPPAQSAPVPDLTENQHRHVDQMAVTTELLAEILASRA